MRLLLEVSPFNIQITSSIPIVLDNLKALYPTNLIKEVEDETLCDYYVSLDYSGFVRKYIKPQCSFKFDEYEPFLGLPINHAYANLEWGINYVIASNAFNFLIIHSGIVAKGDNAVLFPAPPGSGKSTLTAYLQGCPDWRLLSDEMALIQPTNLQAIPFVRPICLKNRSCELIKQWHPNLAHSTTASKTHKGDVVHVAPSPQSWQKRNTPAKIRAVVFPNYKAGAELEIYKLTKAQGFMQLAENAFNFSLLGAEGFDTLTHLIEEIECYEIYYSDVEEVKAFLQEELLDEHE